MTPAEWLVLLAGVVAIGLVNWWFLGAERLVGAAAMHQGVQQATIVVDGGYAPSVVQLAAGTPARLIFDRRDEGSCSEEVVIPDLGIRRFLPPHARTTIELPAVPAGQYEFVCGMRMLRGRLDVQAAQAGHHG